MRSTQTGYAVLFPASLTERARTDRLSADLTGRRPERGYRLRYPRDTLEAPGEPRISTRHGGFVTRGQCDEMPGEPPAGPGRVVLVKRIIMKEGAAVGDAILLMCY
ncbi:hypothetical protein EYF80_064134 [Liparis tanakae]|uniref:Uncharacterized protein n=1 Tax=Liparis tanakae TaxID=230148 RepID=A0A4Z2EB15_9TELE|nr:hypothetical protein EYF80_064134 [Liparis tanakae]